MNGGAWVCLVHIGAGFHSKRNEPRYKRALRTALIAAQEILSQNGSAIDAVSAAICVLENDEITNAGFGSNLNYVGRVECDACLMDGGSGRYGSVAAAPGIRNPIKAAKELLIQGLSGPMSLGRVRPMMLASQEAWKWAAKNGLETAAKEELSTYLIAESAQATWEDHISRVQRYDANSGEIIDFGHDTVGAIALDCHGKTAAGVSSGGISLKLPGRVGEAAIGGVGCVAHDAFGDIPAYACSISGTGEQIMRAQLSMKFERHVEAGKDAFKSNQDSLQHFLRVIKEPIGSNAGLISFTKSNSLLTLSWAHTTDSMGIGYTCHEKPDPHVIMSRKDKDLHANSEESIVTSGVVFSLECDEDENHESDEGFEGFEGFEGPQKSDRDE